MAYLNAFEEKERELGSFGYQCDHGHPSISTKPTFSKIKPKAQLMRSSTGMNLKATSKTSRVKSIAMGVGLQNNLKSGGETHKLNPGYSMSNTIEATMQKLKKKDKNKSSLTEA